MTLDTEFDKLKNFEDQRRLYMNDISNKIKSVEDFLKTSTIDFFVEIDIFNYYKLAWSPITKRIIIIDINNISKPVIEYQFLIRDRIIKEDYLLKFLLKINNILTGKNILIG
jgi:hypothetical protein